MRQDVARTQPIENQVIVIDGQQWRVVALRCVRDDDMHGKRKRRKGEKIALIERRPTPEELACGYRECAHVPYGLLDFGKRRLRT